MDAEGRFYVVMPRCPKCGFSITQTMKLPPDGRVRQVCGDCLHEWEPWLQETEKGSFTREEK